MLIRRNVSWTFCDRSGWRRAALGRNKWTTRRRTMEAAHYRSASQYRLDWRFFCLSAEPATLAHAEGPPFRRSPLAFRATFTEVPIYRTPSTLTMYQKQKPWIVF